MIWWEHSLCFYEMICKMEKRHSQKGYAVSQKTFLILSFEFLPGPILVAPRHVL